MKWLLVANNKLTEVKLLMGSKHFEIITNFPAFRLSATTKATCMNLKITFTGFIGTVSYHVSVSIRKFLLEYFTSNTRSLKPFVKVHSFPVSLKT